MRTGYNIREGSVILAERRRQREAEYLEQTRKAHKSFLRRLDKRSARRAA